MTPFNLIGKSGHCFVLIACLFCIQGCTTQDNFTESDPVLDLQNSAETSPTFLAATITSADVPQGLQEKSSHFSESRVGEEISPQDSVIPNPESWSHESSDIFQRDRQGKRKIQVIDNDFMIQSTDFDTGKAEPIPSEKIFSSKIQPEIKRAEKKLIGTPLAPTNQNVDVPSEQEIKESSETIGLEKLGKNLAIETPTTGNNDQEKDPILTTKLPKPTLEKQQMREPPISPKQTLEPPSRVVFGSLTGSVTIKDKRKILPPNDVIVVLEPTDSSLIPQQPSQTHIIDTKRKKFRPRYFHIRVHDSVIFRNTDPFMHNVFSLSGLNKFDLGTYGRDTEPSHTFEHPGLVKVYCNIHPSMACFIMVSHSPWGYITSRDGQLRIKNLPTGTYDLNAWNIRGEFNDTIEILPNKATRVEIQIDGSNYKEKSHLNKFGKKYPKKSGDEFY